MIQLVCQTSQDIGENKIAISLYDSMEAGLRAGSPVRVIGNKPTVAQVIISDEHEPGQVLMGATMRINASVSEGEEVQVSPLEAKVLQMVPAPLFQGTPYERRLVLSTIIR